MANRVAITLQRSLQLVTPWLVGFLLLAGASGASASAYLPPPGQIFQGVTDKPVAAYEAAAGKHPAVYQEFLAWNEWLPGITYDATTAQARLMVAIGTRSGTREMITPAQLAAGEGDSWLIGLNQAFAAFGHPVYVRLMGEMDGYWNAYCAYNANGSSRGPSHSAAAYRQAWRRVTLILRGGSLAQIDATLARLGMPPVRTGVLSLPGLPPLTVSTALPTPQVAMVWVPQSAGAPDIPGNQPRAYWPGRAWVDWVGTDFYSKFPNFSALSHFYGEFPGLPFLFGEYALWGADDPGFVTRLFSWTRSHPRVRMLVYNQGAQTYGPFRLLRYPRAALRLRDELASPRFPAYAPDWQPQP